MKAKKGYRATIITSFFFTMDRVTRMDEVTWENILFNGVEEEKQKSAKSILTECCGSDPLPFLMLGERAHHCILQGLLPDYAPKLMDNIQCVS